MFTVTIRDMVIGHGADGSVVGLDDFSGLSDFIDSILALRRWGRLKDGGRVMQS